MSETKVEIIPAKEVSAVMSHPESCMCEICQPGSGMVYSPEGSSGAEQRIAALEEQLQIRDAEIHLLKESRAAAVSQEQTSRVECNKLRTQLAEAQAERNAALVTVGLQDDGIVSLQQQRDQAQAACARLEAVCAYLREWAHKISAIDYTSGIRGAECLSFLNNEGESLLSECDRLRKALVSLWNKGPDCPGVQEEVEAALKGKP